MSKKLPLVLALLMVAVACGSDPLSNLGGRSSRFFDLAEPPPSAVPAPVVPTTRADQLEELRGLAAVQWYQQDDPIWGPSGLETLEPEQILDMIWTQSSKRDVFVQSSPGEIAAGLPEIEFPSLLPGTVEYVSSQLVFVTETGEPAEQFQAAFGFWTVFPYTQSREIGQYGTLWAGTATSGVVYSDPADGELACPALGIADVRGCRVTPIGTIVGWWHRVPDGGRLVWFDGAYRYELFLRSASAEDMAVRMGESMQPLDDLLP